MFSKGGKLLEFQGIQRFPKFYRRAADQKSAKSKSIPRRPLPPPPLVDLKSVIPPPPPVDIKSAKHRFSLLLLDVHAEAHILWTIRHLAI